MARRESPSDLAVPVRIVTTRSWLALILLVAIVVAGIGWSFVGRIPIATEAIGMLLPVRGSFQVQAPSAGQTTRVDVAPGQQVRSDDVLARLVVAGRSLRVHTAVPGRVTEVLVQEGQFVTAGAALFVVDRVVDGQDRTVAMLWLLSDEGAEVRPGLPVEVAVDSAPVAVYGRIPGRVLEVGSAPESQRQVAGFVGDDDIAATLVGAGAARRVVVELERDAATASGFAWSRGAGPPFVLSTRTGVRVWIRQPTARPIDWVLP